MKNFTYRRNDTFRLKYVPDFISLNNNNYHVLRTNSESDTELGNIILFKAQSHSLKLVLCLERRRKIGRVHNNQSVWVNKC